MALPFLVIHLLTLQVGDAVVGRSEAGVSNAERDPGDTNLQETIVVGSGNNTWVTGATTAEIPSKIGDRDVSLLPELEIRTRRSKPLNLDENEYQSNAVTVDVDDEDDLEKLKNFIAQYEPRRINSRKVERKLANDTHDTRVANHAGSQSSLERTYHEMLRNISRNAPRLMTNNTDATSHPYLSRAMKGLKHIYVPEASVHTGGKRTRSKIDHPPLPRKRTKILMKKYLQPARSVTILPSIEISESDEQMDNDAKSATSEYPKVRKYKKKIGWPSNDYSDHTRKSGTSSERMNSQYPSMQIASPLTLRPDDGNAHDAPTADNLDKERSNFPDHVRVNIPPPMSGYSLDTPRPFSISQLADALNSTRKHHTTAFDRQLLRSPANVSPFVLPLDLFRQPDPRVPTKQASHIGFDGKAATTIATETNARYVTPYANVIGASTGSPLVAANNHRGTSDYYAVTEKPARQTIAQTKSRVSNETSTYERVPVRRTGDLPAVYNNGFLSGIGAYAGGKPALPDANPTVAFYNDVAKLYFPNLLYTPKAITEDYENFKQAGGVSRALTSQQASDSPSATPTPIPPTSLKIRPIASDELLARYRDSESAVVPEQEAPDEREPDADKVKEENVETAKRSRGDEDENEEEIADDKNDTTGNYEGGEIREVPNRQRDTVDPERNYYRHKQRQDRGQQHKHRVNDGGRYEKYEDAPRQSDDVDDVDETENESKDDRDQRYNEHEYARDDPEDEQRHHRNKYIDKQQDRRPDADVAGIKQEFVSNRRYLEPRAQDAEYRDRYHRRKPERAKERERYEEQRRKEGNTVEDETAGRSSEDRRQRGEYKEQRNNGDRKASEHRYDRTSLREDSKTRREHASEEYGESNPERIREEHRDSRQYTNDHHRDRDHRTHRNGHRDDDNEAAHDHVHDETQEHTHERRQHEEQHDDKKEEKVDHEFEKGEGAKHEEEHHSNEGGKGHKDYEVWDEHEKAEKGHHDKEHDRKEYDEEDGEEKKHEEEDEYHEERQHGEEGTKTAEFDEKGEHQKGHNTKGEHSVHKKDEYEKKTEFYDESHEDDDTEKQGEYYHEHSSKKGGHEKKAHSDAADHEEHHGKEEKYERGGHHREHKGHGMDEGHDRHYDHEQTYGNEEGREQGNKWTFEKGREG